MRKFTTVLMVFLLSVVQVWAQNRTVTGKVTDNNGAAMQGATVTASGSKKGTSTGADGSFTLSVPANAKSLTISGVSVATQTIAIPASGVVSVKMESSKGEIVPEVLVSTQLGQSKKREEIGYSATTIRAAEVTQAKVINLANGLTGKASGVSIITTDNSVFENVRITFRGIRSLTGNNQPMLILDGVPLPLSLMSSINPNDIADYTLLKDASATALYGPDGANGAIVITTKKGFKTKPQITFSSTVQFQTVSYMPKFQTQFGSGSSEDDNKYGIYDPIENQCYGPQFDGSMVQIGRDDPNGKQFLTTYSAKPEEKRKFWDRGITLQNDISYSHGDFYLSLQDVSIKGIVPSDKNHRTTLRIFSQKEYEKFKAGFTVMYTQGNYDITTSDPYWSLINTPMHIPITQFKDWKNNYWANPNGYYNDYYQNPYFEIDNQRETGRKHDVVANIDLNYKLASWLTASYRIGFTYQGSTRQLTNKSFVYSQFAKSTGKYIAGTDLTANVANAISNTTRANGEFLLTATKKYNKFKVEGILGHTFRETQSNSLSISNGLGFLNIFSPIARKSENSNPVAGRTIQRIQRVFGKVSVGYDDWLYGEVTGNYETNSYLSNPNNHAGSSLSSFYPSANVSVVLSNKLEFLKNSKTITKLRLKGSFAKTASPGPITYATAENTFTNGSFPYGTLQGFTASNTIANPFLKFEQILTYNGGIEFNLFKDKLEIGASYYYQDNSNQNLTASLSAATGYSNASYNSARFYNEGLELDLRINKVINTRNFNLDIKMNYSYQHNKVTSVLDEFNVNELGIGNFNYVVKGYSAYVFKLNDYVRTDDGKVVVDKVTGMPSVDASPKIFGSTIPNNYFGIQFITTYKNWGLSINVDHRSGAYTFNTIGRDMDFTGVSLRSGQNNRRPFIFPNSVYLDGGKYVDNKNVFTRSGGYGFWESDAYNRNAYSNYLAPADFWKLREVAITYDFPMSTKSKVIKSVKATISGRNLLTWVPKTNEWTDPEFSNTTGNAQGFNDTDNTPPTRIWGASISLTF